MRLVSLIVITLIVTLMFSLVSYALNEKPVVVNGHVYKQDGRTPYADVDVKVKCNGQIKYDKTNSQGYYVVEFFQGCKPGNIVIVEANKIVKYAIVKEGNYYKNFIYINLAIPEIIENNQTNINFNGHGSLEIKSLILEDENVNDKLITYVRIKNIGNDQEKRINLRVSVDELDIRQLIVIPDLDPNEVRLKIFELEIPKNTAKNTYVLKVKVFNSYSQETESVEFTKN